MMVKRKKAKKIDWSYYVTKPNLMVFIEEDRNIKNREAIKRCLYRVKVAFMFLLFFLAICTEAQPFDVNGFKDGMSGVKPEKLLIEGI